MSSRLVTLTPFLDRAYNFGEKEAITSLRHTTDTQRAVRSLPLGQVMKTVASGQ